jgi:hypothetical protein
MYLIPHRKKAAAKQVYDPIQIPEMPAARPKRPSKRGPHNDDTVWICKPVLDCNLIYDDSTN